MANSPAPSVEKARCLAALIRQSRTLLILDGVEPLQYPPGEPHNGKIRDEALRVLLNEDAAGAANTCALGGHVAGGGDAIGNQPLGEAGVEAASDGVFGNADIVRKEADLDGRGVV